MKLSYYYLISIHAFVIIHKHIQALKCHVELKIFHRVMKLAGVITWRRKDSEEQWSFSVSITYR